MDGLGLGLNRFRCCRLRLGGDGCLEGGIGQVEARAHLHFVGVTQLVDADQAGHRQLVGLGDLREGLPFGNGVFRGSRDRGYSHGLEGRTGHHGIAGKSQGLADLNVVGIAQVVEGHQVATADLVSAGNAAEGFPAVDAMAARACRHGGAWHLQAAPGLNKVWIADPIHPHQRADAHPITVGDIGECFAGPHRHRGSRG